MIVVMAVGSSAKLTVNPLDAITVTVQRNLLVGDQEFDSPKTWPFLYLGLLCLYLHWCLIITHCE